MSPAGVVEARVEGAADGLGGTFIGVLGSREEAIREATGWALRWLGRFQRPSFP
jgi:hypothetical protein